MVEHDVPDGSIDFRLHFDSQKWEVDSDGARRTDSDDYFHGQWFVGGDE